MDENDWATCTDPQAMFHLVQDRLTTRQIRCFTFACGRRHCFILPEAAASQEYYARYKPAVDDLCSRILDAAERYDDRVETMATVEALRQEFWEGKEAPIGLMWDIHATVEGNMAYWIRRFEDRTRSAREQASLDAKEVWGGYAERLVQADLIRDILGPLPFRAPSINPSWLTPLVRSLAQATYDRRIAPDSSRPGELVLDPARLLVLSDALEDAGCTSPAILNHLRASTRHYRGCHVLDALLDKE